MKLPVYSIDLIQELDAMFPDQCPDLKLSDREIWFKAGQRAVVRFLLSRIKELEEAELPQILNKENE